MLNRAHRRLERRLIAGADDARVPPPPGLCAATLERLRAGSPDAATPRRRLLPLALAAVLLAAAATAAAMRFRPQHPGAANRTDGHVVAIQLPDVGASIGDRLRRLKAPSPDPLRTEALLVLADARQVRDYLLAQLPRPRVPGAKAAQAAVPQRS